MSQRRDCFPLIDKEAGVNGVVLRPLSARLLDITFPEEKGLVNRYMLYDFAGRSRKPQMALADEFGLTDYPAPAGGCLLTDPIYSFRLKDLLKHNEKPAYRDIHLLRAGRHFRYSHDCKIVVGRNKKENELIKSCADTEDFTLQVEDFGSPLTIILGNATHNAIAFAASLCARYSDAKKIPEVKVAVLRNGKRYSLNVQPANNETIECYRIEKKKPV